MSRLKQDRDERNLFSARALQAIAVIAICLVALAARFAWLQIYAHETFAARSEENRVRVRPLPPPRGLIFDRNGVLLADNRLAYRLELVPEHAGEIPETWAALSKIMALDDELKADFERERKQHRRFQGVPIKLRLSEEEVARFALAAHRFQGVQVVPYLTRNYPLGSALAHVVGYVGRIDADDLTPEKIPAYAGTSHIGKIGIEAYYEAILLGKVGFERAEVNAAGRTVRELKRTPPTPGQNLYLSIDVKLQQATIAAFGEQSGAAVAIDPRNGEVLAMVSLPSFDPNLYVNGISKRDYQILITDPLRPTFHRALSGTYPPGSTFKPFVAMAGLELGLRTAQSTVVSRGVYVLPGGRQGYRDWKPGGHGVVNLHEALAQSVNTYFYDLAFDLGIDRMHDYLQQFGFGAATGIDLNGEATGLLPSKEWKRRVRKQAWFPGETVVCGIGQGQISATPLQLAYASAVLAEQGVARPPHLLRAMQNELRGALTGNRVPSKNPQGFVRNLENWQTVRDGMVAVLHGPTGTARATGAGSNYQIAGKTGTAQQVGAAAARDASGELSARFRNQALFVAFAPADLPQIAIGLVVEQGGSGSRAAAPVGRKILDAFLLPQNVPQLSPAAELPPHSVASALGAELGGEELPIEQLEVELAPEVAPAPTPEASL